MRTHLSSTLRVALGGASPAVTHPHLAREVPRLLSRTASCVHAVRSSSLQVHYGDSKKQAGRVDSLLGTKQRERGDWTFKKQVKWSWESTVHNSETSSCAAYTELEESNRRLISYCTNNTISADLVTSTD